MLYIRQDRHGFDCVTMFMRRALVSGLLDDSRIPSLSRNQYGNPKQLMRWLDYTCMDTWTSPTRRWPETILRIGFHLRLRQSRPFVHDGHCRRSESKFTCGFRIARILLQIVTSVLSIELPRNPRVRRRRQAGTCCGVTGAEA